MKRLLAGDGPLPDLSPLRDSPAIEEIFVNDVKELDLSVLAGRRGLTVRVDRSTTVYGVDRLGPGSRVIRR